ncbi:MAG: N-acetyl-gamma-glutamyl-phosphate reductase [Elusimicrobia bacterium ADurb.Bin231]|nr:MAG: N-acetyl-gamma-glutamyl-phosphate reductase [Elusimicrobia bacterium ADurb.Bin231]
MTKVKVSIIGVKGYAGEELLKILLRHKFVEIVSVSGRMDGKPRHICEMYPYLKGKADIFCEDIVEEKISELSDVVFTALPHGVPMSIVPAILSKGKKVIDLSGDFRLRNIKEYEKWYGIDHSAKALIKRAVYGLPEIYRNKIKRASLIANPGCYPTTVILGCLPLLKKDLVHKTGIISDSKSGISGGGRNFVKNYSGPDTYAYKIAGIHRHIPEIEQEITLSDILGSPVRITFTPHILAQERGMLSTIYMKLKHKSDREELFAVFRKYYSKEIFVRVVESAHTKHVENTNFCDISVDVDRRTGYAIVTSAIDNLVKGAAGQAVQNLNIMCGFKEQEGLL